MPFSGPSHGYTVRVSGEPTRQDFYNRARAFANGTAWLLLLGSLVGGAALVVLGHNAVAVIAGVALAVIGGGVGAAWIRLEWRRAAADPTIRY